jgi:hypothetical protein
MGLATTSSGAATTTGLNRTGVPTKIQTFFKDENKQI